MGFEDEIDHLTEGWALVDAEASKPPDGLVCEVIHGIGDIPPDVREVTASGVVRVVDTRRQK